MGKFRDHWSSAKFILKSKQDQDRITEQKALHRFEQLSPEVGAPEGTSAIFTALKSQRGPATGKWLRALMPEQQAPELLHQAPDSVGSFEETLVWMNALFKEFESLIYEFNKTAVGSHLLMSYSPPIVSETKSIDDDWFTSTVKTCQGRMTTRHWALILNGNIKGISIALVPAEKSLAFSAGTDPNDQIPPFLEILQSPSTNEWTINNEETSRSAIPALAKELLSDLILVSSGAMSPSELLVRDKVCTEVETEAECKQSAPLNVQNTNQKAAPVDLSMDDAGRIVDSIAERELKRLYAEAMNLLPTSTNSNAIRKQISAVEAFRKKMVDAFIEYNQLLQPSSSPAPPELEPAFELEPKPKFKPKGLLR